jgi:2-C-methyl-D-erythritol 4-phosphate cytidylyltransferase/2-C-methyl-D-erythritol 2,4-cyclodiphosphate synthase
MEAAFQAVALVPAAGEGRRMGPGKTKVWRYINGEPILVATIKSLKRAPELSAVFLIVPPGEVNSYKSLLAEYELIVEGWIEGGVKRQDSVRNGVYMLKDWGGWVVPIERRLVAIHDAARPLIDPELVGTVCHMASECGAAGLGVPVKDTIKKISPTGEILETPPRDQLWAIQTPQVFQLPLILEAHKSAYRDGIIGTDDCMLVERMGRTVRIVEGSYRNVKITTPEDIQVAEALRGGGQEYLVGQGYDVHCLVQERRLIIGGETIEYELGLLGHSDADVLIHAVMDALLGAAGLGDIGRLFPDNDPAFKDVDSRDLLKEVAWRIRGVGYKVVNIDATIIAQQPKMAPYIPNMQRNIAEDLGLRLERVNIKATTTESLGFTGRGEGIAAQAVAGLARW